MGGSGGSSLARESKLSRGTWGPAWSSRMQRCPHTFSGLSLSFLLEHGIHFHALSHIIILLSGSEAGLERPVNQRLGPLRMSARLCPREPPPPRASPTPGDRTTARQHTSPLGSCCKLRAQAACPLAGLGPSLTRASACPLWFSLSGKK